MAALDVKEIHGYEPAFGFRVFRDEAVALESERFNGRKRRSLPRCGESDGLAVTTREIAPFFSRWT